MNKISDVSNSLLELKKKKSALLQERNNHMKTKCDMVKKKRLEEYKQKNKDLDDAERNLCRKTNQLMQELVSASDESPFNKSLIKILGNMKGIYIFFLLC